MGNIKILRAVIEDIDQVKEIEIESGLSAWSKADYRQEINSKNELFLVAKSKEIVIGFVLARLIMYKTSFIEEFEIEIYNIAVKKEFRREKTATSLLKRIARKASERGAKKIYLEVRESNTGGIKFYDKNSFTVVGMRRNFYSNPTENAVLMCCIPGKEKNG